MTPTCEIRLARPEDVAALPQLEVAAGLLFKTHPGELGISDEMYEYPNEEALFAAAQEEGRLWVASVGEAVVGFALLREVGGAAHLEEIDVLPAHGRQGIGGALLEAACAGARAAGYPIISLRTFREVAWNAPFYARHGFRIVESASLSPAHLALEDEEEASGLRRSLRVTMARTLGG